ncbi:AT-hook motif nuclear-localized protein 20-like [Cicer arietinum]|uniref:AT-hook motif nuclear-localized protein n=1 Tax=Cicer arietinum TaxID=3827 RepID=A0A1S2XV19_CICAR|nr:AT-hook motif nuclear-localized protein 20-like [Cicer arietinum]
MSNPWWSNTMALPGADNSSPKKSFSLNNTTSTATSSHKEERENSEETKEGAIEVGPTRRSRGRPLGSKNKPKSQVFVTRDGPHALRSHVIEVANGADITDCLIEFSRRHQRGVCVLSGTGAVINVHLRQPTIPSTVMALHGRFEIISLSGSFLPGTSLPGSTGLTVCVAGIQGQVMGGAVVGPLVASGTVVIMAATFSNAMYERLPLPIQEEDRREGAPF